MIQSDQALRYIPKTLVTRYLKKVYDQNCRKQTPPTTTCASFVQFEAYPWIIISFCSNFFSCFVLFKHELFVELHFFWLCICACVCGWWFHPLFQVTLDFSLASSSPCIFLPFENTFNLIDNKWWKLATWSVNGIIVIILWWIRWSN